MLNYCPRYRFSPKKKPEKEKTTQILILEVLLRSSLPRISSLDLICKDFNKETEIAKRFTQKQSLVHLTLFHHLYAKTKIQSVLLALYYALRVKK